MMHGDAGTDDRDDYPASGAFSRVIARTVADSVPAWPEPMRSAPGAPNVLVVLLDDVGFAQLGCYGSDIATPTFDRLAADGLRYRRFHTTTVCAPSRACLLTGRNHHTNAMGTLPERPRGFPGYTARVPRENGFLSEILQGRGYATFAVGKWHLTPYDETAAGSTRTRWPLGRGFDRFYGFLGGATSQWTPDLVYDNHPIAPPCTPEQGYHLNEDMADRAIEFVSDLRAADPDKPFFMYYCPGAGHEPHHVPQEWADRYSGRFDAGWDRWRERVFARQLESDIIPAGTKLAPRPEWIPPWDGLDADRRRLYARQMEVFAGFLEHTDHHIGRVTAFLESAGELDNTIVLIASDNGASSEGGPHGRTGNVTRFVGDLGGERGPAFGSSDEDAAAVAANLRLLDEWGGPNTDPNYSWGWAWAGNTPLRRWKRFLHEGGISDPLIVHWPHAIAARGEVRDQYAHITDLTPTILDMLSIEPPAEIDGVTQSPMHGVSFAHTFDDPDVPTRKTVQYYEYLGSRALWADGWKAVAEQQQGVPLTEDGLAAQRWELYHVAEDFSEAKNLAEQHPDRLKQLVEQWWAEAGKHLVMPLAADSTTPYRGIPEPHVVRPRYVYHPHAAPVPTAVAADVLNRPHRIAAHIERPAGDENGVLLAHGGGTNGGYSLFIQDNRLHYVNSYNGLEEHHICADNTLPSGTLTAELEFTKTDEHQGVAVLRVNDEEVGRGEIPRIMDRMYLRCSLYCGHDSGVPVTTGYQAPFRFTGKITRVVVETVGTVGRAV